MTAFLFIPANAGSRGARRVDFANIASLFTEGEEPARRSDARRTMFRTLAAALLLLLALGDTLLLRRPGAVAELPAAHATAARATF